jgi:hypothetical protein
VPRVTGMITGYRGMPPGMPRVTRDFWLGGMLPFLDCTRTTLIVIPSTDFIQTLLSLRQHLRQHVLLWL